MIKNKKALLAIVIVGYLLTHLVFLFFSPFAYYEEDNKFGTLALDLIHRNLQLPFWCYLDSPHSGGSILSSLIAIPFYLLFGEIYLALKISGIFVSLAIFLVILYLITEEYGVIASVPLALLFIFPTPNLLIHRLIRAGNTSESVFFIMLSLVLTYYFLRKRAKKGEIAALLGLISGLGLWVQYGQMTAIFCLFFLWFLLDKRFFLRRNFLIFCLFFLIGFSPFILFNLQYNFASFNADVFVKEEIFSDILFLNFSKIFQRFRVVIFSFLPKSFLLPPIFTLSSRSISLLFYFLIGFLMAYLFWSNRIFLKKLFSLKKENLLVSRDKKSLLETIFLIYLLISIFLLSIFKIPVGAETNWGKISVFSYYYYVFLHPFFLVVAAISLSKISKNRLMMGFILTIMMVILFVGFMRITFKGGSEVLGWQVGKPNQQNFDRVKVFKKFGFKSYLFENNANIGANAFESGFYYSRNPKLFWRILPQIKKDLRLNYFIGAGVSYSYLLREGASISDKTQKFLIDLSKEMDNQEKEAFYCALLDGEWFWAKGKERKIATYSLLSGIKDLSSDKEILHQALSTCL